MKSSYSILLAVLTVFVVIATLIALCTGVFYLSVPQVVDSIIAYVQNNFSASSTAETIVMNVRMPRIITAIFVGASLATAGAVYQSVFHNPLVSPDLLGVSSGSCIGVALSILLGLGSIFNIILAFIGGVLAVGMTVLIPNIMRNRSSTMLVLSGVMVSGFLSSILGIIKYMADNEDKLETITYWQFGSFAHTQYGTLKAVSPILVISFIALMLFAWRINLFSLEDSEVQTLGVNVEKERLVIILFSTLLTAAATSISGTVGWVGLVVPHFARMLVGDNTRKLLPVSALLSAGLMIIVDTICRSISGLEIPVGIITGVVGAPIFSGILVRQKKMDQAI